MQKKGSFKEIDPDEFEASAIPLEKVEKKEMFKKVEASFGSIHLSRS